MNAELKSKVLEAIYQDIGWIRKLTEMSVGADFLATENTLKKREALAKEIEAEDIRMADAAPEMEKLLRRFDNEGINAWTPAMLNRTRALLAKIDGDGKTRSMGTAE